MLIITFLKRLLFSFCVFISLCQKSAYSPVVLESKKIHLSPTPVVQRVKILFAGDMMFDRHIREQAKIKGQAYPLQSLKGFLSQYDLVIGNLEGPITDFESLSVGSVPGSSRNYIFTFPSYVPQVLSEYNIKVVNLGNNHILNFGRKGFNQTLDYLKENKIDFFGSVAEVGFNQTLIKELNGIRIGLVNYNEFTQLPKESVLIKIKELDPQVDFLVVYTHWGVGYEKIANPSIRRLAHEFIDSGADLIIGSHPHVIQNKEDYKDKRIYYSLGNFVFDQYFSEDVKTGLLVEVKLQKQLGKEILADYKEYKVRIDKDKGLGLEE